MGLEADVKPIVISVGNEMVLSGFDSELIGKEIGKKYTIHLLPEQAFGKRDPSLIRILPMKIFREKNINPAPGMAFQMDNHLVRILSVSGGRITTDFNNPLAGKEIDYEFTIKQKIEDNTEKVNALQDFFYKRRFEFVIDTDTQKVIFKDENIKPLVQMLAPKFKEMTGFDFVVEENKGEKKEQAKKEQAKEDSEKKESNDKEANKEI